MIPSIPMNQCRCGLCDYFACHTSDIWKKNFYDLFFERLDGFFYLHSWYLKHYLVRQQFFNDVHDLFHSSSHINSSKTIFASFTQKCFIYPQGKRRIFLHFCSRSHNDIFYFKPQKEDHIFLKWMICLPMETWLIWNFLSSVNL